MVQASIPTLPGFGNLLLTTLTISETVITLTASVAAQAAPCPNCGTSSKRRHSSYDRHPRDLPWRGIPVQFTLHVRRFFCDNALCLRSTFAEQVDGFTQRYAHRTLSLNSTLQTLGLALGGQAGAAIAHKLGISGSSRTVLRRVHASSPPSVPAPRVVGIDEWAFRKGHTYGSIIVDLERHQPIALLPEHTAESIATWFEQHPTVEIIARDRASVYGEALQKGAPQARQVADRWHLMHNLGTVLQDVLSHHTRSLREVAHQLTRPQARTPELTGARFPSDVQPEMPGHIVGPIELRQFQFGEVKRLRDAGWSYRRIARLVQLNWRTVVKYSKAEQIPRRMLPQTTSSVTPYLPLVRELWLGGQADGVQLLAALQAQGYSGSISSVYRALKAFRSEDGRRIEGDLRGERVPARSPRQAMWLLVRAAEELSEADRTYRVALLAHDPTIATAAQLGQRFLALIRERQVNAFDVWLDDAETCGIKELRNFARSLRRDYEPVKAALELIWSNGQTEGQVNRLKMIKRTMFGRASFELLRRRVLGAQ